MSVFVTVEMQEQAVEVVVADIRRIQGVLKVSRLCDKKPPRCAARWDGDGQARCEKTQRHGGKHHAVSENYGTVEW